MVRIAGFHPADPGSSPGVGIYADIAKWLMRRTCNAKVPSSSLGFGFTQHSSVGRA